MGFEQQPPMDICEGFGHVLETNGEFCATVGAVTRTAAILSLVVDMKRPSSQNGCTCMLVQLGLSPVGSKAIMGPHNGLHLCILDMFQQSIWTHAHTTAQTVPMLYQFWVLAPFTVASSSPSIGLVITVTVTAYIFWNNFTTHIFL